MADWTQLVIKAEQTVGVALDYLHRRAAETPSPAERDRLMVWADALGKAVTDVKATEGYVPNLEAPTWDIYFHGLDFSQQQFQRLHEYYDYSGVEFVVSGLHQNLVAMAGPHGPGGGRPGK